MKKYLFPSLKMTLAMILLCVVVYTALVVGIGKLAPGGGSGEKLEFQGRVVGYDRIGQHFDADWYFWGRPSAVDYNAAGSGASNKGPSNADYLAQVKERVDTLLAKHPYLTREQIPADMVTGSGSGLDPHISPAAALIQVQRVAKARGISGTEVEKLVKENTEQSLLGIAGPSAVHVLRLNIALDTKFPLQWDTTHNKQ
jgi:K+-transporting ATPase ATPase C chain